MSSRSQVPFKCLLPSVSDHPFHIDRISLPHLLGEEPYFGVSGMDFNHSLLAGHDMYLVLE